MFENITGGGLAVVTKTEPIDYHVSEMIKFGIMPFYVFTDLSIPEFAWIKQQHPQATALLLALNHKAPYS